MKKKSITKLSLKKASISTLNAKALHGGNNTLSIIVCESQDFCETIDYTACRGEYYCQIYPYPTDQNF
ncbi:class I lanthipeptide [uncultured Kordia sp.]|uniref:class I lanthipeptide n=1 Tax=uncultured Kordia sp. TaxID=507699 RepID=UPI00260722C5|nr:class I lanthipeptide [uncultured Kordia sp.]